MNAEFFVYFCKYELAKAIDYECNVTQKSVDLPTGAFTYSE